MSESRANARTRGSGEKRMPSAEYGLIVLTIGHSTHTLEEFIGLLQAFRGYVDYMQTPEFKKALDQLIELAKQDRIALMCAEAVPWRCHRSVIADALSVRRIRTEDIMSLTRRQIHSLTPFAKVRGTAITYPTEDSGNTQKKPSAKRSWPQLVTKTTHREG